MSLEKRTICTGIAITFVVLSCLANAPNVAATEPSDILLAYVYGSQTLTVNVSHYVANTKTHYIETIEIVKNGISVLNRSYVNQSANWGMYDTFNIPAVISDNLTVTALCSKGYSLTKWVVITSTTATNTGTTTGTTTDTSSSTTSTTTETTGDGVSPGTPLDLAPAVAAGAVVVIFFVIFFAWLKPEYVPDALRQLGSRIRKQAVLFGEKLRGLASWLKAGFSGLLQHVTTRLSSR